MTERRKQDHDAVDISGDVTDDEKMKSSGSHWFVVVVILKFVQMCKIDRRKVSKDFKESPIQTLKYIFYKIGFAFWCIVIFFSMLRLFGFNINPATYVKEQAFSLSSGLPFGSGATVEASDIKKSDDKTDDDVIPQQFIPTTANKKFTRAKEIELSCQELDCNTKCNSKSSSKCKKSKSCERTKVCRKRCRKARCEDRCKDEPKLGYVEREQKMDKCKDGCGGSTAAHNKCIKKCHSEYKPCNKRCHETAHRYQCDRIDTVEETSTSNDNSADYGGGDDADAGGDEEEDSPIQVNDNSGGGDDDDDELL